MLPSRVRGCWCRADCSRERAGGSPVILSTSGLVRLFDSLSGPGGQAVQKASAGFGKKRVERQGGLAGAGRTAEGDQLAEGRSRFRFCRLCWRAPRMEMGRFMSGQSGEGALVDSPFFNDKAARRNVTKKFGMPVDGDSTFRREGAFQGPCIQAFST